MKYLLIAFLLVFQFAQAQDLDYYFPSGTQFNENIPSPEEFLGYQVGEWHVTHDQIVYYLKALAQTSERVHIQEYARSHEDRPLVLLTITSPENHANLEKIRQQHADLTNPGAKTDMEKAKLVHWMGYSVHGNEASGANAALLMAYYLAATTDPWLDKVLDEEVILLDPAFNPDGIQRFSTWVNAHKSKTLVSDPKAREFDEVWPGGRTNHYWFDLNRDWMPVQHPESKGRIRLFHEWKPNVLTDHHEMGSSSTFFFQPGVPSRKSPMTPQSNVEMTKRIAKYHANALDSIGSLYFSEENYDDFYIGKGSTYPDLNGAIGILFEQASARGHVQDTPFGQLTFPFAIRNHLVTSFSTLQAAYELKSDLLKHQKNFYEEASDLAKADPVKAYVFGDEKDPMRSYHLMEIIAQHDINVYAVTEPIEKDAKQFHRGAYLIPTNQPQYRLIKAMFETRTEFEDSLFYDVSSWTLPLAFNLKYAELGSADFSSSNYSKDQASLSPPQCQVIGEGAYAYMFEPFGYYAHRAVNRLQEKGILIEIAHNAHHSGHKHFSRGSFIIPIGLQRDKREVIEKTIRVIAEKDGINVYGLSTGLSALGSDLGSRNMEVIDQPKIALLVGEGMDYTEAGEVWHLLDDRMGMRVTLLPCKAISEADLDKYNKLVMVNGSFRDISESAISKIKTWVAEGGVIITWKRGGKWLADKGIAKAEYLKLAGDTTRLQRYENVYLNRGAQVIGGAIFKARLDTSHPLCYGLDQDEMPLFRDHSYMLSKAENPYANPLVYTSSPLISGYISEEKLAPLANTPAVVVSQLGRGRVVNFTDNPNFRAFWYGTNKLFLNALFLGQTISGAAAEE